jgi:hypothetical protein
MKVLRTCIRIGQLSIVICVVTLFAATPRVAAEEAAGRGGSAELEYAEKLSKTHG